MSDAFERFRQDSLIRINQALEQHLPALPGEAPRLREAMRYGVLNGGKRVRALLLLATCEALGGDHRQALPAACAVEFLHAYSLIHDDLPSMDDDDLRRGLPTCHVAFDEATAILAGDALQSLAFEILFEAGDYTAETRLALGRELGRAAGHRGMVAGQMVDLQATGSPLTLPELEAMHRLKTGALIVASVQMGALIARPQLEPPIAARLRDFATALGLAFQIRDDIIDVESDTTTLGKTSGKDAADNKPTYPSLLGLEGARTQLQSVLAQAQGALAEAGLGQTLLAALVNYVGTRQH